MPTAPSNSTERLVIFRSYVLAIEQKTLALWGNDQSASCFDRAVNALRACLKDLHDLEKDGDCQKKKGGVQGEPDCRDYYEQCSDGVCRIWCS